LINGTTQENIIYTKNDQTGETKCVRDRNHKEYLVSEKYQTYWERFEATDNANFPLDIYNCVRFNGLEWYYTKK